MTPPARTWLIVAFGLAIVASAISLPIAARAAQSGNTPTKAVTITLYGSFSAPAGWGWAASNVTEPGPTLNVQQGDVITFQLFAKDAVQHELVIDLNNNQMLDPGTDKNSTAFSSATVAVTFVFTASTAGNFNYFCGIHGYAAQHGTLAVQATGGTTPPPADNTLLIVGGVVILVVIVAAAAAMMMRRKKPKPPMQP
jgi:plastocyanin